MLALVLRHNLSAAAGSREVCLGLGGKVLSHALPRVLVLKAWLVLRPLPPWAKLGNSNVQTRPHCGMCLLTDDECTQRASRPCSVLPPIPPLQEGSEALEWCSVQCGNSFHTTCFAAWRGNKQQRGEAVTCPICRVHWPQAAVAGGGRGRRPSAAAACRRALRFAQQPLIHHSCLGPHACFGTGTARRRAYAAMLTTPRGFLDATWRRSSAPLQPRSAPPAALCSMLPC